MPQARINGSTLNYRLDGAEDAPVLVLSNSLGTTLAMWDAQLPALTPHFRVLRYDARGHSGSQLPESPCSIEQLGQDVLGLLDELGIAQAYFCGLSIGGLTGQWLAVNAPQRFTRMVICNTAAKIGTVESWNARIALVAQSGMAEVAAGALARWFTPAFVEAQPAAVEAVRQQLLGTPAAGYAAVCAAVRDADFRDRLPSVCVPLLVIAGSADPVATAADAQAIVDAVPDAQLVVLDAAHLSNIEAQTAFDRAVLAFLLADPAQPMHERERYACGLARRREVLGEAHVDRSLANRTPLTEEFQELITRLAWGTVWTRPGLPGHTRSLLTIAMLVALNRDGELRLHLNAARRNGVTREQIKETLLQSAIYCGVPAANHAFQLAQEVFDEQDLDVEKSEKS